jgi:hypothetical protein
MTPGRAPLPGAIRYRRTVPGARTADWRTVGRGRQTDFFRFPVSHRDRTLTERPKAILLFRAKKCFNHLTPVPIKKESLGARARPALEVEILFAAGRLKRLSPRPFASE